MEEVDNALVEGGVFVVYCFVEELSSEVTQVYMYGIGWWLQHVEQVDVWRLGVGLETRGDGGDIYQIIGFVYDEFGHIHAVLDANMHEVDLCVFMQNLFQVRPIGFSSQP